MQDEIFWFPPQSIATCHISQDQIDTQGTEMHFGKTNTYDIYQTSTVLSLCTSINVERKIQKTLMSSHNAFLQFHFSNKY